MFIVQRHRECASSVGAKYVVAFAYSISLPRAGAAANRIDYKYSAPPELSL